MQVKEKLKFEIAPFKNDFNTIDNNICTRCYLSNR